MPRYKINAVAEYGFILVLNPMMGNTENQKEFGPFETKDQLMSFYNGEKTELYREEGPNMFGPDPKTYSKSFKKDGPLEWMNPLMESEFETPGHHGHGIHEVILSVNDIEKIEEIL